MPSFSYTVKEELCSEITDRDKKYACLYGMLISSKHFDFDKIVFQTKNDKLFSLFKDLILSVSNLFCLLSPSDYFEANPRCRINSVCIMSVCISIKDMSSNSPFS